jgi:excisionase family DNA binding protein
VEDAERLLTPGEVASLFRVDPKTVTRWAAAGRISSIRTPGGHRRFRESEVRGLLAGDHDATLHDAPAEVVVTDGVVVPDGPSTDGMATPGQRRPRGSHDVNVVDIVEATTR